MSRYRTARLAALAVLLYLTFCPVHAASMLRIACEGQNAGAVISVNGKPRGSCPLDIQVAAGSVHVTAVKKFADGQERIFERVMEVGDGTVARVTIELDSRAIYDMIRGAEAGDELSMQRVAFLYKKRDDQEKALYWNMKLAERGRTSAMFSVGDHYRDGAGVPSDAGKANAWYKRAFEKASKEAEAGNTDAMVQIGMAHLLGRGVAEDREKAISWLRMAKSKGHPSVNELLQMVGAR